MSVPGIGWSNDHDARLLLLAGLICFFATAIAIGLYHRAQTSSGKGRFIWLGLTAIASGYGIWASNFLTILSFGEALGAGYDLRFATFSFLSAAAANCIGVYIAANHFRGWKAPVGTIIVGGGMALMFLSAMLALELPARLVWMRGFYLAIVLGVSLEGLAFIIGARWNTWLSIACASGLATLGILLTHFLMISQTQFLPSSTIFTQKTISSMPLSLLLAALAILILAMCFAAALSDNNTRQQVGRQKSLTDSALESISQGLCMYDADGRIIMFNERYAKMTGTRSEKLLGRSLLDLIKDRKDAGDFQGDPQSYFDKIVAAIRAGQSNSTVIITPNGRVFRVIDRPIKGGGWVATLEDVTDWQEAQAKISHMAQHDALTDLPNRRLFRDELDHALHRLARDEQVAVLSLDLDHFKEVNDSLGHPIGDALLTEVAQRLTQSIRQGDTVARLGGDEFALVQVGMDLKASEAAALATRLIETISTPYKIEGNEIIIGASIGIAIAPVDGVSPDHLMQNADIALYRAKSDGRNTFRFFQVGMDSQTQARRLLMLELRTALIRSEFEVYYQPIHDLKQNRIICFEALVRWQHPSRGLVSPAEFIPLAEESGLIVQIGEWVLKKACLDAASWPDSISVAVNLSPVQFRNRHLVANVRSALIASGLSSDRLELEITEAVLLQDVESNLAILHELREMGISVAIDDFGTGYSSLSYLQSFPFDKIKIDQSFIRSISSNKDALAIVRAVAGLGKSLGIRTLAEGVETDEQLSMLRSEGCFEMQGFLFDKPRPADEIDLMLQKQLRVVS